MEQIVSIAYPYYIVPLLLNQVSKESIKKIPRWNIAKLLKSTEFQILHNQCLFTGLSDGSQIDIFRRSSSKINHESKSTNVQESLEAVMYDFSASGTSYINKKSLKTSI